MSHRPSNRITEWEAHEADTAGLEAAAIGGHAGDELLDPAHRPVIEAGGGVAEGFELAEQDLIEAASLGANRSLPVRDQPRPENSEAGRAVYGEADEEHSSESSTDDR